MRLNGDPRCLDALAVRERRRRPDGRWQPDAYRWKSARHAARHGTRDLAVLLDCNMLQAQPTAYCLRMIKIVESAGKRGHTPPHRTGEYACPA